MIKHFQTKYHLRLSNAILTQLINYPVMLSLNGIISSNKDCYDVVIYLFEGDRDNPEYDDIINIDYFRNLSRQYNNQEVDSESYIIEMKSLLDDLGGTGNEKLIDFFMSNTGTDLAILTYIRHKIKYKLLIEFMNGVCRSGNVELFKKYLKIFRDDFSYQILPSFNKHNLYEIIKAENLFSSSIEMLIYFNELNLLSHYMRNDTDITYNYNINSIVYTLIKEDTQMFDYVYQIFSNIDNNYSINIEKLSNDIALADIVYQVKNPYRSGLLTLYKRGLIDSSIVLKTSILTNRAIQMIIWTFQIPSNIFLSVYHSIPNKHSRMERILNNFKNDGYIKE